MELIYITFICMYAKMFKKVVEISHPPSMEQFHDLQEELEESFHEDDIGEVSVNFDGVSHINSYIHTCMFLNICIYVCACIHIYVCISMFLFVVLFDNSMYF